MEITKELLEDLYIKQNLSPKKIKEILGCSRNSVRQYLKDFGIEKKSREQISQGAKETCLRKFGTLSYSQTQEYKERVKQTSLEKYGTEYYTQTDESKKRYRKTCLEKYGVDNAAKSKSIKQKAKETFLKKYNALGPMANETVKQKANQTFKEKYGCHPRSTEEVQDKYKKTCLEKYGVENYSQTDQYRDQYKETCLERYGVTSPTQCKEIQNRINATKRKNGTFNTSKPQQDCETFLRKIYPDLIIEYDKDPRYPWKCDFYIPSKDLFIECQFSHYHYKEPYDPDNIEHQKRLTILKERDEAISTKINKSQYSRMIKVWIKEDPLKRQTAKEKGLNYLEFFNEQDFYNYFN